MADNESVDLSVLGGYQENLWSRRFACIYGNYAWLNAKPIHYFLTTLSVKDLHAEVKLMGEIPGVECWGFEALFQRQLDEERVAEEIVGGYLRAKARFKFFPPVSIAVLPARDNQPLRDYPEASFTAGLSEQGSLNWTMEGLKLEWPAVRKENQNPALGAPAWLSWRHDAFIAVAIDGQHRISALRKFVPRSDQGAGLKDLPAVILVVDPTPLPQRDVLHITREIFVDVNQNANRVDESRLILLNDRNVCSVVTRELLLQDVESEMIPNRSRVDPALDLEVLQGVPQELVNITVGKESADVRKLTEWQFTSAYILHHAIRNFAVENRFKAFELLLETQAFAADSENDAESAVAERRLYYETQNGENEDEEVIPNDEMFSFTPKVARELAERFLARWGALFRGVLTGFRPYADHIERLRSALTSLKEPEDRLAFRRLLLAEGGGGRGQGLKSATAGKLKEENPSRFEMLRKHMARVSKPGEWENDLAWFSILQRGLLLQPNMVRRAMELARRKPYDSREEFATAYVDALNSLYAEGWFKRDHKHGESLVWGGIALKLGEDGKETIDSSDGAARRCGYMLRLLVSAVASRGLGSSWTLPFRNSQGVKGAVTAAGNGIARHLCVKDQGLSKSAASKKASAIVSTLWSEVASGPSV